ncbi:hypothetical protein [Salininema proteolyticum]|uniref:Uncharacterized protein n=1 Tax=Salininema proteolyticum TaxID=1607685 RepID=A0ABV8TTK8_9ACTN
MTECATCPRPVADTGYICHDCADRLRTRLQWIAANADELDVTVTRQDRISDGTGGRASAETPLPFNADASEAAWVLRNTLTTWARRVAAQRGLDEPADNLPALARWLHDHVRWLRCQPFAYEAHDELHYAAGVLQRAVDAPTPQVELGACGTDGCAGHLAAPHGAVTVQCRDCRARYDVDRLQRSLLDRADILLMPASDIASILSQWRRTRVAPSTVRSWASRGRLAARGHDDHGRTLYRLGDARRLADVGQAKMVAA